MLVLDRDRLESINIGDNIEIKILLIKNKKTVRIGINAPKEMGIHRNEIYKKIQANKLLKQKLENNKEEDDGGRQ